MERKGFAAMGCNTMDNSHDPSGKDLMQQINARWERALRQRKKKTFALTSNFFSALL